jgi:hypothetical protein
VQGGRACAGASLPGPRGAGMTLVEVARAAFLSEASTAP